MLRQAVDHKLPIGTFAPKKSLCSNPRTRTVSAATVGHADAKKSFTGAFGAFGELPKQLVRQVSIPLSLGMCGLSLWFDTKRDLTCASMCTP